MTLRHLHIFRTVCHTGSITEAAARINMTQPAVSLAIKELESFYQTRLFDLFLCALHHFFSFDGFYCLFDKYWLFQLTEL